jgi:predicted DNA-binding transcriptional regulator AlpA
MLQQHSEIQPPRRAARSQASDESLISGRQLRQLLGNCSEMHIWRLLNKQELQPLAFPRPIKINGRNYWRLGAIRGWIEDQEVKSGHAPAPFASPPPKARKRQRRKASR